MSHHLRLDCPGISLRIRSQPSFEGLDVGLLQTGDVVEVSSEDLGEFYQLFDGRGYVAKYCDGVKWYSDIENSNPAQIKIDPDDEETTSISGHLSEPNYLETIWAITCRPVSRLNVFSENILLFQPDVRLFCHKGIECDIHSADHRSRYCHIIPSDDIPGPSLENPYSVPNVKSTWTLLNGMFSNSNIIDSKIPQNSQLVLFVHGHRTKYFRAIAGLTHLNSVVQEMTMKSKRLDPKQRVPCGDEKNVYVMGFIWPCHKNKGSYSRARAKTLDASRILLQSVAALQQKGNRVILVGHSLGARIVLGALNMDSNRCAVTQRAGADTQTQEDDQPLKQSLVATAAAVPADALSTEFPLQTLSVGTLLNFYSSRDVVLAKGYELGEVLSTWDVFRYMGGTSAALGLVGANPAPVSPPLNPVFEATKRTDIQVNGLMAPAKGIHSSIEGVCLPVTGTEDCQGSEEREHKEGLGSEPSYRGNDSQTAAVPQLVAESTASAVAETPPAVSPRPLPRFIDCDVSDEVGSHSVHAYLNSVTFRDFLSRVLLS